MGTKKIMSLFFTKIHLLFFEHYHIAINNLSM